MVSNKRIAKVLRRAVNELRMNDRLTSTYKSFFICNAISEADDAANYPDFDAVRRAKEIISSRLGKDLYRPHTVDTWLESKGYITFRQHRTPMVQEYRMRWLKSLIKEFSTK